jgi:hypothetical protein
VQVERGNYAAGAQLRLRAPAWSVARVAPGQRVIAALQTVRRDPTLTDRRILDPRGPLLLIGAGLEPAVFRDDARSRGRLFSAEGTFRQPTLAEVLEGLGDADPHWQNYYANELALRSPLRDAVDAEGLLRVQAAMTDRDLHPSARAALFRAAQQFPAADADWWHAAANQALADLPLIPAADPGDTTPDLARTLFELFSSSGVVPHPDAVTRWVLSRQPALVELALLAVRQAQPDLEAGLIEQALQQTMLDARMRMFLLDHQRRLRVMRDALAQKPARA